MIDLLLVDDHEVLTQQFANMFNEPDGIGTVHTTTNPMKLPDVLQQHAISVIFMDIRMPTMNGFEAVSYIRERGFIESVVMYSNYHSLEYLNMAWELQVSGYLPKSASKPEIMEAIQCVERGEHYFHHTLKSDAAANLTTAANQIPPNYRELLSHREVAILRGLREDQTASEIGESIGINQGMVDRYLKNLKYKLRLPLVVALIAFAKEKEF